jgi:hypothetical protein
MKHSLLFLPPLFFFLGVISGAIVGTSRLLRVVHGLWESGEGGREGCHCQGMREVGEWGSGHGCRVLGALFFSGIHIGCSGHSVRYKSK